MRSSSFIYTFYSPMLNLPYLLFTTGLSLMTLVIMCFEQIFPPSPTVETVCMDTMKTSWLPVPFGGTFP